MSKEKLRSTMDTLLSGTPLRLQAAQTKELGVHTNEQFQMAHHIVAPRQRTCYFFSKGGVCTCHLVCTCQGYIALTCKKHALFNKI